jgi:hypothetical protein
MPDNRYSCSHPELRSSDWKSFKKNLHTYFAELNKLKQKPEAIPTPIRTISLTNYPNPFNPETKVCVTIPSAGKTSLKIYNLKGQLVTTLFEGELGKGKFTYTWQGKDLQGKTAASGIYFTKLESGNTSIVKKMLLLK